MSRGRRPFTITQRVVWAVTGTVALLVGLQTVLACFAMHVQEDELTDDMLHREVRHLIGLAQRPGLMPAGALVASPRVQAWLSRGGEGASDVPADVRRLAPGLHQLEPPGQVLHVAVVDTEDGRLSVVLDATESESRVHCFGLTLLALWLVCVTATAFIARGVAAIAVGPIVAATRSIARWSPEKSAADALPRDEASTLMEAFNRFRDRADETVAREREFAANLDHEIRTPLTAIRTDAKLIGLAAPLAPSRSSASSASSPASMRSSPPPHRRCRRAQGASSTPSRSTCARSCAPPATRWAIAPRRARCASPSTSLAASRSSPTGRPCSRSAATS